MCFIIANEAGDVEPNDIDWGYTAPRGRSRYRQAAAAVAAAAVATGTWKKNWNNI